MSCEPRNFNVAKWLPSDTVLVNKWLEKKLKELKAERKDNLDLLTKKYPVVSNISEAIAMMHMQAPADVDEVARELHLHAPVRDLMEAIQTDPKICMFFHQMFSQQADHADPGGIRVPCWQVALLLINQIMTEAPEYHADALIHVPIGAVLNLPSGTPAGFACFLDNKVNSLFKNILNYWGKFLTTKASCYVLTADHDGGWFTDEALAAMPGFVDLYECDPNAEFWGYASYDDFFVRKFRPNMRPIASPENDYVVVNACEATPLRISYNVRKRDCFWVKAQKYSMDFLLNMSPLSNRFEGGTVYQGFLRATSYHRFHSPVNGIIYDIDIVEGSYFSKAYSEDRSLLLRETQEYLAHVATRGIVYIMADNPDIGLMAFIAIGMADVSTVQLTIEKNQRVKKGQEIGMFHFGGSSHVLIFCPGVNLEFDMHGIQPGQDAHKNIKVNARIATVIPLESRSEI